MRTRTASTWAWTLSLSGILLLLSGCEWKLEPYRDASSCNEDADCGAALICRENVCRSPEPQDAGPICTPTGPESCTDGLDNDCDDLVDCQDPACEAQACGALGAACAQGVCVCSGNGGTAENPESSCSDGFDNDCDAQTDCGDSDCVGQSCGANGLACANGTCACSGNGGLAEASETLCGDDADNDCDGLKDCADPDCGTRACSTTGSICSGAACVCTGNSGTAQSVESTCNDSNDNDCDGLADCADTNCSGKPCGTNGRVCGDNSCVCGGNGGVAQASESSCTDGFDNDCDGVVDCMDSDCPACASGTVCRASTSSCVQVDYTQGTTNDAFINACNLNGRTQVLGGQDDASSTPADMLIPFKFYGDTVSRYWVSTNGVVGFGNNTQFDSGFACPLPRTDEPRPAIFPFADDLDARGRSGICIGVTGTAPNRKMVFTWNDIDLYDFDGSSLTFSVVLSETSNTIDFMYQTLNGSSTVAGSGNAVSGSSALIGLQNGAASLSTQHSCNDGGSVSEGTKLRFTPQP